MGRPDSGLRAARAGVAEGPGPAGSGLADRGRPGGGAMNRPASDLRQTQQLFWALITAPEGARPAAENLLRRGTVAPGEIDAIFSGDDRLPALERIDIYANMYFYRLLD